MASSAFVDELVPHLGQLGGVAGHSRQPAGVVPNDSDLGHASIGVGNADIGWIYPD
jgi:hypothetical protein